MIDKELYENVGMVFNYYYEVCSGGSVFIGEQHCEAVFLPLLSVDGVI